LIKIEVVPIENSNDTKVNWFNHLIPNHGTLDIKSPSSSEIYRKSGKYRIDNDLEHLES